MYEHKKTQQPHLQNSFSEVHESVIVPSQVSSWRRWLAITGPALMVSVGYMDPGNWATDIAGESRYNYALIWVLLMSNMMAIRNFKEEANLIQKFGDEYH